MILLKYLFVFMCALCCNADTDSDIPPNYCGDPPRIENKDLKGIWDKTYYEPGTKAVYTCFPGFIQRESTAYVCIQGKWETLGSPGQCKKRPCRHPGEIKFGTFKLKNEEQFVFGAIVEYTCDKGYNMVNKVRIIICTATGEWSSSAPTCEAVPCQPLKVDENVNIVYTSDDEEHTYGQVVRFECKHHNQTLNGPSTIFCTSEGKWNLDPPKCTEFVCTRPIIVNGKPKTGSQNDFNAKETIEYECDKGYKPSRTPQTTCTAQGWSPTPVCDEIDCNLEGMNGKIENPKLVYRDGETVILQCEGDYIPEGDPDELRKCTSHGWHPPLRCIEKSCPMPDIQNGKIYDLLPFIPHFPMSIGASFYYTCDEDFSPPNRMNYDKSFCKREGWHPVPTCLKKCSIPSEEINADILKDNSTYYEGDKIQFHCKDGYQTQDERIKGEIECINGSFVVQKCFRFCQKPDIKNGFINTTKTKFKVGSFVTYTCSEGFYSENKLFKDVSDCTNDGWKPVPNCKAISCTLENIDEVFKSGDVVHFKCQEGEELHGHNSSQCYHYGWGPEVPICSRTLIASSLIEKDYIPEIKCPSASAPPSSTIKYLNNNMDVVEIVCSRGYILDGPAKITCKNGKWQSPPMCIKAKRCFQPPQIANGEIIEDTGAYYDGSIVKYRCKEGYHMITSDTSTCLYGRWATPPTCKENSCGKPEEIKDGNINTNKTEFNPGEHAIYECSEGYKLSRNASICSQGTWKYIPECTDTSCGRPPSILNGEVIGIIKEKYLTGQHVYYECVSGYSMKDNLNHVTCMNSQWTEKPVCSRTGRSCGKPPKVNSGETLEKIKEINPSGSSITYACIYYYKLEGNEKIQCKDGKWEEAPVCRAPCTVKEKDLKINNIQLQNLPDKKYMEHSDNISFECLPGYGISDEKLLNIQCLDGKLNYPKCYKHEIS